jgi:hypothetical protein
MRASGALPNTVQNRRNASTRAAVTVLRAPFHNDGKGTMPEVSPDPSAASTSVTPIYVWESQVRPGEYALCTDPRHRDFQTANWWRFRGELATVPELDGFPRPTIANGWPMRVRRGD